jgi:hypothetical protein
MNVVNMSGETKVVNMGAEINFSPQITGHCFEKGLQLVVIATRGESQPESFFIEFGFALRPVHHILIETPTYFPPEVPDLDPNAVGTWE